MTEVDFRRWQNMLVTAFSDHELTDEELEYLAQISTRMGISFDEINKSLNSIMTGGSRFDAGATPKEQRETLNDVICVALADGNIDENELAVIKKVAASIGMNEPELESLIDICREWVENNNS
ncbi:MAG: TerB family tellurite resistance protein [Planctomycetota bacterium]